MPPNNHRRRKSERGNVFIFILLGLVLFAALSYAVARGFRSDTTSQMTDRQATLATADFIANATKISRAIDRLRRSGCSESEINLEITGVYSPANASSPLDKSCHVFDPAGGNLREDTMASTLFADKSASTDDLKGIWGVKILGVGDDDRTDIVFSSWNISLDACIQYNKSVNVNNPGGIPPQDDLNTEYAELTNGDFEDATLATGLGDDAAAIVSKPSFCFHNPVWNNYEIIYVLLER